MKRSLYYVKSLLARIETLERENRRLREPPSLMAMEQARWAQHQYLSQQNVFGPPIDSYGAQAAACHEMQTAADNVRRHM